MRLDGNHPVSEAPGSNDPTVGSLAKEEHTIARGHPVSPVPEAPVAGDHTSSTGRRHVSREICCRVTGLASVPDQYEGRHPGSLTPRPKPPGTGPALTGERADRGLSERNVGGLSSIHDHASCGLPDVAYRHRRRRGRLRSQHLTAPLRCCRRLRHRQMWSLPALRRTRPIQAIQVIPVNLRSPHRAPRSPVSSRVQRACSLSCEKHPGEAIAWGSSRARLRDVNDSTSEITRGVRSKTLTLAQRWLIGMAGIAA